MKIMSNLSSLLIVITIFTLTGCATNRGVVRLDLPDSVEATQANGKQVFINTVIDQREFQENPKTQDIPSLGFGGSSAATADIKKRAIGRKRNSFGKALGDILIEDGQTVENVIRDALKRSFSELGYKVVENPDKTTNMIVVNANIHKFWAYMTPGFWEITLSSDISTDITLEIPDKNGIDTKKVSVHSENNFQVGSEKNWMEIIHASLKKYVDEVKKTI